MARSSAAGASASSSQTLIPGLPPHEPVMHALTTSAYTSLQALSRSRQFQLLDEHHKAALDLLTECAVDIIDLNHQRTNSRRKEEERRKEIARTKRSTTVRERSTTARDSDEEDHESSENEDQDEMDMDDSENRIEDEELSRRVDQVRGSTDLHVQKIIDGMQRRRDDENILKDLLRIAEEQRAEVEAGTRGTQSFPQRLTQRLSRGDVDDSQYSRLSSVTEPGETQQHDTQPEFLQPSLDFVQKSQEAKDSYALLSNFRKYANHNDYIYFRRQVWEATHGDEEVSMPSRSKWFPEDGRGASPAPGMAEAGASLDDDDEDIQTIRVRISTKCPLSLKEMENPVSSRKCPHVFEKMAVEQYIREFRMSLQQNRRGPIGNPACPVTGCNEQIGLPDLYVDPAVQRKIRRIQELRRRENENHAEEVDESLLRRGMSRTVGFEDVEEDYSDEFDS